MHSLFQNLSHRFLFLSIAAVLLLVLWSGAAIRDGGWVTQVAQVGGATQEVSATIRVSSEVNCEAPAAPITRIYFDIKPEEGGVIRLIDHDMVRQFGVRAISEEAPLDGWFFNGEYQAQLEPLPGYAVARGFETISFSVNINCDKLASLPSPLPPPPPAVEVATTTAVTPPPLPAPKTTPPPAPKVELAPSPALVASPPSTTPTTTAVIATATTLLEECASEEACREVCASGSGSSLQCAAYITEVMLEVPPAAGSEPLPSPETEVIENYIHAREGVRVFADTDSDGVVDFDEVNIFRTDPKKADSDNDGMTDGDELIALSDPATLGTTTTVIFQDPSQYGAVMGTGTLAVTAIAGGEITNDASGTPHLSSLILSGHGPANAYITLFIYSEPIIVTVKTDPSGVWTYQLDRELPDGTHKVYTALTDNGGRVIAKSEPLPFVKQASAISVGTAFLPNQEQAPTFFGGESAVAMASLLAAVLLASVIIIGIFVRTKNNEDTGGTPGMA